MASAPASSASLPSAPYKLTRKTIGKDWSLWAIYLTSTVGTIVTESEIVLARFWEPVLSGSSKPARQIRTPRHASGDLAPLPLGMSSSSMLPRASNETSGSNRSVFHQGGRFVFGSGLAIVPFLYGGVVKEYGGSTTSSSSTPWRWP